MNDRQMIRQRAKDRLHLIEMRSANREFTENISTYGLLMRLIALGNFDDYFADCACWQGINCDDAQNGKVDLGFGPLTAFEKDCVAALSQEIERREESDQAHRKICFKVSIPNPSDICPNGKTS
jgi:hypothetical protein